MEAKRNLIPRGIPAVIFLIFMAAIGRLPAAADQEDIVIGKKISVDSEILEESRVLLISLPADYDTSTDRYPVLYLLDGDWHFHHVSGILRFFAWARKPIPMIVVAIPNTHRGRDFSPAVWPGYDSYTGGADRFIRFMQEELIPAIDRKYRTQSYRVLCGHSLAGTFALYAFLSSPELCDATISLSPCLFWHDGFMLKKTEEFLGKHKALNKILFIAHEYADRAPLSTMEEFTGALTGRAPKGLRWTSLYKENEDHFSYVHKAIYDGLEYVFKNK